MLFMVIERFHRGVEEVGARFKEKGRMMPDGVEYVASWMETSGGSCYQLMEAPDRASLGSWIRNWSDLVDFEVVLVTPSAEYWSRASSRA